MQNTTSAYKTAIRQSGRELIPHLTVLLSDGTSLTLGAEHIMQGGLVKEDGVSTPNTLQVGCACMRQLAVTLNNYEGAYTGKDFTGAVITASVGLMLPDGTEEQVSLGKYTVDEAVDNGVTISLTALDGMDKFDRPYSSALAYPATLKQILQGCCADCGVLLQTQSFLNDDYTVSTRPDDANLTYRQMVSYVAQLAGCWAKINSSGYLTLDWYDFDRFVVEAGLDGNTDTADGLTDSYDGGLFNVSEYGEGSHTVLRPAELDQLQSLTISNSDITVTGVQVVPPDDDDTAYLAGSEGYVLSIEGNPLTQGDYEALAWSLYGKIGPMTFRPCSVSSRGDPSWEAGDVAYVTDRKGVRHRTVISNLTYSIDGWEKISADAETVSRKQSSYSNTTRIVQAARTEVARKLTAYDLQAKYLNDLMSLSMGFYRTEVTGEDGAKVAYLHDKPELSESLTIWKNTIDGFAVSTDGGSTWSAGIDSNGNALVNVLSAKGINADWIKTGRIESQDGHLYFDLTAGEGTMTKLISASGLPIWLEVGSKNVGAETINAITAYMNDKMVTAITGNGNRASSKYTTELGSRYLSQGDIIITANAGKTGMAQLGNMIGLYRESDGTGSIEISRCLSNGYPFTVFESHDSETLLIHASESGDDGIGLHLADGTLNVFTSDEYVKFSVSGTRTNVHTPLYVQGVQVTSDREKKSNIRPATCKALDKVKGLKFYSYDMGSSATEPSVKGQAKSVDTSDGQLPAYHVELGVMHDEAPQEIQTHDAEGSKSIDLYAYINLLAKAVQELTSKVEALESQLQSKE